MTTTTTIVGSGAYTFEAHEDWAKLPPGWEMPWVTFWYALERGALGSTPVSER